MYIYELILMDAGLEEVRWQTMNLEVAGVLFDYLRKLCDEYNDLSMRFCMDCRLEAREV